MYEGVDQRTLEDKILGTMIADLSIMCLDRKDLESTVNSAVGEIAHIRRLLKKEKTK